MLLVIVALLVSYALLRWNFESKSNSSFTVDKQLQKQFDSLKVASLEEKKGDPKPFNPNFISDFKGYTLGMSTEEIDRLHAFREQNRFLSSAREFQEVTQVSDTLLNEISPFFRFPEWTRTMVNQSFKKKDEENSRTTNTAIRDLNTATVSELERINGIGPVLSKRIVKFRDRLGGFLINEQLYDVYGLEPEVVDRTLRYFEVLSVPEIEKININTATAEELAGLVYISFSVAKNIVNTRETNGAYQSFDDLFNVESFPVNKIERIALYLSY